MADKISKTVLRIVLMGIVFLMVYGIIVYKLWNEQIRKGEEHRKSISQQSIRRIRQPAVRGRIYSADEGILADNRPSFNIVFHLAEMRQPGWRSNTVKHIMECAARTALTIGRKNTLSEQKIIRHMNVRPGLPMTIFKDLNPRELAAASEIFPPVQGMEIAAVPLRFYPEKQFGAHAIGYIGREDPKKADDRSEYFYYIPDQIGKRGVEKKYDDTLKGTPGNMVARVDHLGYIHELIGTPAPAKCGNDIILTINKKAQMIAEKLLEGKRGAIVVLNAETGAVKVFASSPAFDLNKFAEGISADDWQSLQKNPEQPLTNRASMGAYTPGSILKPLIAMAILACGISPNQTVHCNGATRIGNAFVRCWTWKTGGHGTVRLIDAIRGSCNDYFIEQGLKAGLDNIAEALKSAGIGQLTGFCLPERKGLLPSREEKMRIFHQKWTIFDTAILSIGQGIILITPLQAALYTAAIANGGTLWKPYLLKEKKAPDGKIIYLAKPEKTGTLKVKPGHLKLIRKGMYEVVNSSYGTAKKARNKGMTISGKTGTAEMGPASNRYTNTWFIGFGTHENKTYSIAVFVERGVSGGRTCAPIAGKLFEEWFAPDTAKEKGS